MRWAGLALVVVLLVVGFAAFAYPNLFPGEFGAQLPRAIYLVLALLLVTGAGFGFARVRAEKSRILPAILFWTGAILLIMFLYNLFHRS